MKTPTSFHVVWTLALCTVLAAPARASAQTFNDSHFHLTNYIQEGADINKVLDLMGTTVGRSTLFGIPLQQQWSYRITGDFAPTYYLDTDAKLYYYSFTDAYIATVYNSLRPEQKARFDPMITGFNPTDMYAVDHIRRVLLTFPGVFSGIGEFTIHKEFVSAKVAGDIASLSDPALDRILDFAAEVGLVVVLHNDIAEPFHTPRAESDPINFTRMKDMLKRHPKTTIIWAHVGVGRIIHPLQNHAELIEGILQDPAYSHVYFDISWDEVAKYLAQSTATVERVSEMMNRHPQRFLFGTDVVAPRDTAHYFRTYNLYKPLWEVLSPEVRHQVTVGNYERIFDASRRRVREWERANAAQR